MEATTHVAVGHVHSWFCCCFASKPASVDVEGDGRILVGHKFAIDQVLKVRSSIVDRAIIDAWSKYQRMFYG